MKPVALVTGAARGIGASAVQALVEQHWNVIALDVCADDPSLSYHLSSERELDALVALAPDQILPFVADVRDRGALRDAVRAGVARFGGLHGAIACAGVIGGGSLSWETDERTWQSQIDVNLTGVWNLACAAIPAMIESPDLPRSFVAVSSAAGIKGLPQLGAYSAAKHGVIGLVRSLAGELGPLDITANAVCPGSTNTPLLQASATLYDLESVHEFAAHHHLQRLVDPTEVASLIAYLCSPLARAITGAVLPVDAGMTAK